MSYPTQTNRLAVLIREGRGIAPDPTPAEKRKVQEHLYGFHPQENDPNCPACHCCQIY